MQAEEALETWQQALSDSEAARERLADSLADAEAELADSRAAREVEAQAAAALEGIAGRVSMMLSSLTPLFLDRCSTSPG